jgi:threonyl-tRNA synthetase (EC 6.1.1.3)/Ser-tRNA(Thr) hydrolase (EC 3.1.1.-)
MKRTPYLLIVGEKEFESNTVAVRRQGEGDKGSMSFEAFTQMIQSDIKSMLSDLYI